jgi:hypothetical protein
MGMLLLTPRWSSVLAGRTCNFPNFSVRDHDSNYLSIGQGSAERCAFCGSIHWRDWSEEACYVFITKVVDTMFCVLYYR